MPRRLNISYELHKNIPPKSSTMNNTAAGASPYPPPHKVDVTSSSFLFTRRQPYEPCPHYVDPFFRLVSQHGILETSFRLRRNPHHSTPTTMAPTSGPVSIPTFASTQIALLAAEQASEIAESSALISLHSPAALQRAGLALTNLTVSAQRTGLGGKTVVELGPDAAVSAGEELPEHGIRTGDIVLVSEQPAGSAKKREVKELERKGVRGVVTRVRREWVGVALDEDREDAVAGLGGRVWAVKVADDVTFKR